MNNFEEQFLRPKNEKIHVSQAVEGEQPQKEIDDEEEKKEKHEAGEKVKIILDGKEYELETSSYDFEYPERIQKETGIIGYERTKITASSLFDVVKNEAGSLLDELGVKTSEEFLKMYESYLVTRHDSNGYYTNAYYKRDMDKSVIGIDNEEYQKIESIEKIMININEKIVNLLSDGEYPNFCYTHRIAANVANRSAKMNRQFKEDNFFLQKIYDLERIEKNNTNYGYGNQGSSCSFYKDNGEVLEGYCDLTEINSQSEIKENTGFAAMPNSGLNFWMGDFWDNEMTDHLRSVAFGIPFRSDAFQEEYIKKSLETFCKIEKDELENMSKKNVYDFRKFAGINGTITMYALNEYIKNHPEDIVKYKENGSKSNFKELVWEDSSMKEFGDIIKIFLIDNNITLKDDSYNMEGLKWLINYGEVNLPVFINHKELPQVSWGYAKYAHYSNKQGLNFIKLKHTNHLPEKISH